MANNFINPQAEQQALPCPPRINNARGLVVLQQATAIFEYLCPPTIQVVSVAPGIGRRRLKCHWVVKYADKLHPQPLTDRRIIAALRRVQPVGCDIVTTTKETIPQENIPPN